MHLRKQEAQKNKIYNQQQFIYTSETSKHSPYKKVDVINLSFSISCQCPSTTARAMSNEEALEIATQRWPWKRMGDVRYTASVCA